MKKIFIFLKFASGAIQLCAQNNANSRINNTESGSVGINIENPNQSAVLDMVSPDNSNPKGILLPRLTTKEINEIKNPAHSLLIIDTDLNGIYQNLGTNTNPRWMLLTLPNRNFFYMPSINIPVENLGSSTINLYTEYLSQFASPAYTSKSAPANLKYFSSATDLYYYVTYVNPDVLTINNISADGIMNYTVNKLPTQSDFINIVFIKK